MKKRKPKKESTHVLPNVDESLECNSYYNVEGEFSPSKDDLHKRRSLFYSTLSLWEILIDCSNVKDDIEKEDNSTLSLNGKRLTSIICNLDTLLCKFSQFIAEVCSASKLEKLENSSEFGEGAEENIKGIKDNIHLTENISKFMGSSKTVVSITNPRRIDSEFHNCGLIMDSLLELFMIDEGERSTNMYSAEEYDSPNMTENMNDSNNVGSKNEEKEVLPNNLNIWDHGETDLIRNLSNSDITLNSEEACLNTAIDINDDLSVTYPHKKRRKKCNKAGRPKGSKMKSPDSVVGRFRRLGYYPDYCVSEEVYNLAIEKGTPYCCPLCEKIYKERRSLEKHFAGTVNNKCPGVPVEKPTYKLELGRYYCTQPGCEHEVATHGAKSMGVIWTHHQGEHLSKDANLPFSCDQCPKSFPLHSILASHIASTHELKKCSQICDVCGKTIAGSKNKIKQHMLVHTGEKIKCSQCDITFSRPGSLRRHMQHQHQLQLKQQLHFCDVCGKGWKTRSALNTHLESHKTQSESNQQEYMMNSYNQENG